MANKVVEKYPLLGSSVDPEKLALTVKGILVAIAPVILTLSGIYGWDIGEGLLNDFIENTVLVINSVFLVIGSVTALIGAGRKVYYKVKGK